MICTLCYLSDDGLSGSVNVFYERGENESFLTVSMVIYIVDPVDILWRYTLIGFALSENLGILAN